MSMHHSTQAQAHAALAAMKASKRDDIKHMKQNMSTKASTLRTNILISTHTLPSHVVGEGLSDGSANAPPTHTDTHTHTHAHTLTHERTHARTHTHT